MQRFDNIPTLNKASLLALLLERFSDGEKKLSHIPDPSLLKDAKKAAQKIAQTIKDGKKITVVGDYDVDGISSSAIMNDFFAQIPYPVEIIIPNRFKDGYGVSPNILQRVSSDLVITVDNGISAIEAAQICKEKGIDLIITDHHTAPPILPDAYAIVNPKQSDCQYPFKEICGAQVAWLLLGLLKRELGLNIDMRQFLDTLSIAIIADIMPLIDINRTLVKDGLRVLQTTQKPSSIIIREFLNRKKISAEDIAFMIAPRINSAGRVEDGSSALKFLTASTTAEAFERFEQLGVFNELRKEHEAEATNEAVLLCRNEKKIIVTAKEDWHEGVVGIVASRLVDKFSKPAIVLSICNGHAKGSARSIGNVNIYELIKKNEQLLTKFGGHKMAAGITLEEKNISLFCDAINQSAAQIDDEDFLPQEKITAILHSTQIDIELIEILERFEPYGEANQKPLFLFKDVEVVKVERFGKEKNHSKIFIKDSESQIQPTELILFKNSFELPQTKRLTCSYRISKNEFGSKISTQLIINKIYNY